MRKLKTPGGYCRIGHRGLPEGTFYTADPSNPDTRRFDTESDLNKAMIAQFIENRGSKFKADFYSQAFKRVLQNHKPVFTHADFQRKNIMIRNHSNTDHSETQSEISEPSTP